MALNNLKPQALWQHFENICSIPHPSGYEAKIAQYLIDFAKEHNLECIKDDVGNVIIQRKAAPGFESKKHIILQAHIDMVPLAAKGFLHNFKEDPIKPSIDGDFVKADRTTLGADDGIGVATILALLEDKDLKCGPLRAIFTVEEETSMKGASNLDSKYLDGDYLINLDSEETYNLYVGCQGSCDLVYTFNTEKISTENCTALNLVAANFTGGHSGAEIHCGRANAAVTLAQVLNELTSDFDLFIQNFTSGTLRNAIASEARCTVLIPNETVKAFKDAINTIFLRYKEVYKASDPNMSLDVTEQDNASNKALSYAESISLLSLMLALPLGALRMSSVDSTVTETSNSLGIVESFDDCIKLYTMARSLNDVSLDCLIARIEGICNQYENVDISVENRHACWLSPDKNELIDKLKENFYDVTKHEMKVTVMPAGLECAMFAQNAKSSLQLVSIGALVIGAHTPSERVCIKDVESIYKTVFRTLNAL